VKTQKKSAAFKIRPLKTSATRFSRPKATQADVAGAKLKPNQVAYQQQKDGGTTKIGGNCVV